MQSPGPGHYETNQSSLVSTEFTRFMKNNHSKALISQSNSKISPSGNQQNSIMLSNSSVILNSKRELTNNSVTYLGFGSSAGKLANPGASVPTEVTRYAKGGIPTIPSRYLTPVLKFDAHE